MSGIAGAYSLDGRPAERAALRRMVEAMPHRGPDGTGLWCEGPVGLGHRMLHTTPESLSERLPCEDPASSAVITSDVRIDNRDELIGQLGLRARAHPISDSELVLAAYRRWGERCPERLLGAFAFAVWDRGAQKLFCARDHFGINPLYYHHRAGRAFAFASEIKALLALPSVPARLNEVRVADHLARMREDKEATIYEEILRLPPAHAMAITTGGVRQWKYWTLGPDPDVGAMSDEAYTERFLELFTEAVRCRLRSAFPVGAQLSGGLDSSFVACLARDLLRRQGEGPLHTISCVFDETPACDERPYIEAVLEGGGMAPHFVQGDRYGPLSSLDEIYDVLDDHVAAGNHHLIWEMYRAAQQAGVRVVLDGIDGDNTVSHGELYLKELARAGQWGEFAREVALTTERHRHADHRQGFQEALSNPGVLLTQFGLSELGRLAEQGRWLRFASGARQISRYFSVERGKLYRRYGRKLLVPRPLLRLRRARQGRDSPLPPLVDEAFAQRIGLRKRLKQYEGAALKLEAVRETQRMLFESGRIVPAFEATNHYAAAFSLEARHPFMDKRLIEFCLALPARQSFREGWTRMIMRQAMEGVVPEPVRWRAGKARITPHFTRGLFEVNAEPLRAQVRDLGPLKRYADVAHVQEMYEAGPSLSDADQVQLALVATLAFWLKKRFD